MAEARSAWFDDSLRFIGFGVFVFALVRLLYRVARGLYIHGLARWLYRLPSEEDACGKWAVVTGAAHGIGKSYAFQLASGGFNIVLVSLPEDLQSTANEIADAFPEVKVCSVSVDLAEERSFREISKCVADKNVTFLVNNAAVLNERPEYYLKVEGGEEFCNRQILVNTNAFHRLIWMVLPKMLEKNSGVIVNIASAAGTKPGPLSVVYAATKAFVINFTESLYWEYRHTGITIQCVIPYFVCTRNTAAFRAASWDCPSPDVYVRHAMATIGHAHKTTGYWPHAVLDWYMSWWPKKEIVRFSLKILHKMRLKQS